MLRPHRERPVTEVAYVTLACYNEAFVLCGAWRGGPPPAQMSMDRSRSCSNALLYIKWFAVGSQTVRVFSPQAARHLSACHLGDATSGLGRFGFAGSVGLAAPHALHRFADALLSSVHESHVHRGPASAGGSRRRGGKGASPSPFQSRNR